MPSLAAGMPNWLFSAARRMSACIATCMPPPRQKPRMQAIVGFGKSASKARSVALRFEYSSDAAALWRVFSNWLISAPETNALSPAPTRTTTRTSGSSRNSISACPSPCHMSSDMALRFSGLLKVMTPTPSVMLCRILPSAWDFSVLLGTSSIGAAFGDWIDPAGLKQWLGVSAMAMSLSRLGERTAIMVLRHSPHQVRRQRMIAGLIEECGFLGGGFQKLLVLVVDVIAELNGLVLRHPCRQINPGHRKFPRQMDILALAGGNGRVDRGAAPLRHVLH